MITIKYRLSNKLNDGGVHTYSAYRSGPRNLIKAVDELREAEKRLESAYGNIGFQSAWIEIDGKKLNAEEADRLTAVTYELERAWHRESPIDNPKPTPLTERAKQVLASI